MMVLSTRSSIPAATTGSVDLGGAGGIDARPPATAVEWQAAESAAAA